MQNSYHPGALEPWTEISEHLNQKYQILGTFNLSAYDQNMFALYEDLKGFKSYSFAPNQKIIFYHFETDFYLNGTGFTVYNLQTILNNLDISQSGCIMLTLAYGIEKEIRQLGINICNDTYPMQVVPNSYVMIVSNPFPDQDIQNNFDKIEYPFMCLNGAERSHRVMLLCLLADCELLNKGIVTWNFGERKSSLDKKLPEKTNAVDRISLLSTIPYMPVNDLICWNSELRQIYNRHGIKFIKQSHTHPDASLHTHRSEQGTNWCTTEKAFVKSFLYVATETVFDYPNQFVTEKIFKSFINRRPFVVAGPAHTLKRLHMLGFKTFDRIIDESYDELDNPSERISAVAAIVADISKRPVTELQQMAESISDIIEYNYDYYCNHYCKTDLNRLLETL